ncbi:MAG: adenosylcobinamide-GDP ribazoletransferase [Desulfamplus sp.]|nr:adenosylcobinamide-GDP ribazoletransferase [Desulfamplus sp.]
MRFKAMKIDDLRSAIMFITIIPVGNAPFSPIGMIRFFPVVGLILGLLLVCVDAFASLFWTAPVVALIDAIFLVILTGAFHLDGLGDTSDGLFSHRSKERSLEIMKDSRTGVMGLIAIFISLAIKIAGIYSVKILYSGSGDLLSEILVLTIVPSYSRASMLFGIRYFKYGRDSGTGHSLFEKRLPLRDFIFISVPVILSLMLGFKGLILNSFFVLTVFLILLFYKKKMGCITGDMLGAMCEITESSLFLICGAGLFIL